MLTTEHQLVPDSGGPGTFRGGLGVQKGGVLTQAEGTVMSYCCDRARSVTWGLSGGLPSIPHGVWLNPGSAGERFLGAVFSNETVGSGDAFTRPSAGGGGFGDPLLRDPAAVLEDVADEYVTPERAAKDYGVVVREIDRDLGEWEVDRAATEAERTRLRASRRERLEEDPAAVVARYRRGEIDQLDLIRHHGVILNWDTGELLPNTTEQFRAMLQRRAAAHW